MDNHLNILLFCLSVHPFVQPSHCSTCNQSEFYMTRQLLFQKSWKVLFIRSANLGTKESFRNSSTGLLISYVRKIFRKTNISYPLIRTHTYAYQGVRNFSFSEYFACVLNEWFQTIVLSFSLMGISKLLNIYVAQFPKSFPCLQQRCSLEKEFNEPSQHLLVESEQ